MTSASQLIEIDAVTKRFGSFTALNQVSFSVAQGESVALWGSNGAGKTTLLRCLLGVTSFGGDIRVDGKSVAKSGKSIRAEIGYVPQVMPLFDVPVAEMVLLIARLRGASPDNGVRLLREFGLAETVNKSVRSLSGGMRQKLALTLALLREPTLLVLDEPTANLDAATQKEVLGMLNELRQGGRTVIFTSHRWSEVRALADSVVHLENGSVAEQGPVVRLAPAYDHVSIRLRFANGQVADAERVLTEGELVPFRTGDYIVVSVPDHQKMSVFHRLHQAAIVPIDFDMEVEE